MRTVVNNIDAHPLMNFIISVALLATGKMMHFVPHLQIEAVHIPAFIIESFQILAYMGGGAAGFVALHGWWTKNKTKKK